MRIGVIGAGGYWGKKWVRNLINLDILHGICDLSHDNLNRTESEFELSTKEVLSTIDLDYFLKQHFDGLIIATPPHTHFHIAKEALSRKYNILVEKPLATKIEDCLELKKIQEQYGNIVMLGHTFLFHPGITVEEAKYNEL